MIVNGSHGCMSEGWYVKVVSLHGIDCGVMDM